MSNEEMKSMAAACPNFYWKLFQSTFLISAFTVGGGFVIIPLLRAKYVDEYGWLNDKETLNLVSIAQSMPGVVALIAAAGISFVVLALWNVETLPDDLTAIDPLGVIILLVSLAAVRRKIGVIKLLAATGVAGLVLEIIQKNLLG